MVTVMGLVLNHMGCCGNRLLWFTAVEIPVTTARGTFEGRWVGRGGLRGRHELAATVQSVAAQAGCMIFQAFFVNNRQRRLACCQVMVVRVVALEDAVGER